MRQTLNNLRRLASRIVALQGRWGGVGEVAGFAYLLFTYRGLRRRHGAEFYVTSTIKFLAFSRKTR